MSNEIPMIGRKFGRLTVVKHGGKIKREFAWICICECGKTTNPISGYKLRSGEVKSCGCYKREKTIERSTRHNLCHTRLYRIWSNMRDRCTNPNAEFYHRYGGRGISVCNVWLHSFLSFYEWALENGYASNLTLDRIDNDGNYCPENCRWSTQSEQCNNKGNNVLLEINGITKNIGQWSRETGIKYRTIHARYERGWTGADLIRKTERGV